MINNCNNDNCLISQKWEKNNHFAAGGKVNVITMYIRVNIMCIMGLHTKSKVLITRVNLNLPLKMSLGYLDSLSKQGFLFFQLHS